MNTVVQLLDSVELGNAAQARNSIIWLHGLGADGNDFVSLVPELQYAPLP
jgi:phospholipase/carboxylesterase